MTNEEMFDDLKELVTAQTARLERRMDAMQTDIKDLKSEVSALDEKLDLIQNAIAETFTEANKVTTATLRDHEQRLHRLEQRHA